MGQTYIYIGDWMAQKIRKFCTIEQISNGYLIIDMASQKTHKQTFNGIVNFLEKYFETKFIEDTGVKESKSSTKSH